MTFVPSRLTVCGSTLTHSEHRFSRLQGGSVRSSAARPSPPPTPKPGCKVTLKTDSKGFYSFPTLQIGTYTVEVQETGFKTEKRTDLVIDANSALRADFSLQVGQSVEQVTITAEALYIETESTQMGEVISGKTITAVPLNGRAYTDLLALQPGVSPYIAGDSGTPGISDRAVDGGLNSGNQSVNGQREAANGFMVNGSNVEEGKNNGAAIIPNLDSIAEFRIITNNFDAEYGNYSGGQVNGVTKSGANAWHLCRRAMTPR
jgi:hypothetical protein